MLTITFILNTLVHFYQNYFERIQYKLYLKIINKDYYVYKILFFNL